MNNLTLADVDNAMSTAATLGDRLVSLVALRKRANLEKQTACNEWKADILTEDDCEMVQDTAQAVLGRINNYRIGVEALIS